jgi:hypothetical protein
MSGPGARKDVPGESAAARDQERERADNAELGKLPGRELAQPSMSLPPHEPPARPTGFGRRGWPDSSLVRPVAEHSRQSDANDTVTNYCCRN